MSGITNYDLVADLVRSRIKALRDDLQSGIENGNTLDLKVQYSDVSGSVQKDDNNDRLTMKVNFTVSVSPKPQ